MAVERLLLDRLREDQHLLLHARLLEHEHEQRRRLLDADQLQPLQPRLGRPRHRDDGRVLDRARQHRGGELDPLVLLAPGLVELVADGLLDLPREVALLHQRLDVIAVALVGRHAAGGGVRVADEALVLEPGHLAADGCRRERQVEAAHDRLGADGVRRVDVLADDEAEEPGATFG